MFRFCHPELARWFDRGDDFSGPQSRGADIRYRLLRHLPLLIAGIENRRTIAGSDIIPLAIPGRGIVYLEEELEQLAKCDLRGIEHNFDRFGMRSVIAIRRVRHVTARVPDTGRDNAVEAANQLLHSPKTTAGQYGTFGLHTRSR